MRPALKNQLAGEQFFSVTALLNKCIAIEDTWKTIGHNPEQSMNLTAKHISEITDYSLDDPRHQSVNYSYPMNVEAFRSNDPKPLANSAAQNASANRTTPTCWNCYDIGHDFINCPKDPQHIFCYRCGADNTVKPNCKRCQRKSENLSPGMRASGSHHFRQPVQQPPRLTRTDSASNTDPELAAQRS